MLVDVNLRSLQPLVHMLVVLGNGLGLDVHGQDILGLDLSDDLAHVILCSLQDCDERSMSGWAVWPKRPNCTRIISCVCSRLALKTINSLKKLGKPLAATAR